MTLYVVAAAVILGLIPALIAYLQERAKGENQTPDWWPPLRTGGIIFGSIMLVYLIIIRGIVAKFLVDYWLYAYWGVPDRWTTEKITGIILWMTGLVIALIILSLATALGARAIRIDTPAVENSQRKRATSYGDPTAGYEQAANQWRSYDFWWSLGSFIIIVVTSIIFAGVLASFRFDFQQGLWGKGSSVMDPIRHLDVLGFYDFTLTMVGDMFWWLFWLTIVALAYTFGATAFQSLKFGIYRDKTNHKFEEEGNTLFTRGLNTIKVGLAFMALFAAVNAWMQQYLLLINGNSDVIGEAAGYTDVVFRIPSYNLLAWLLLIAGLIVLFFPLNKNTSTRTLMIPVVALAIPILFRILYVGAVGSWYVQPVTVERQGMTLEETYINNKLDMTKWAWGMDEIRYVDDLAYAKTLTENELHANDDVLSQGRVVDYGLLLNQNAANETQTFYKFNDVDVIPFGGKVYMGSVREINIGSLPSRDVPWVRNHLRFTHGYGYVLVDTSLVSDEGKPLYVVSNKPPVGPADMLVSENGIYFGEEDHGYVIVNTTIPEYDYPVEDAFAETQYEGNAGVPLDSFWRRFIYAVYYDEPKILISNLLTPESRIIYHQTITDMTAKLLPESTYCDPDPYFVIGGEEVTWILNCLTRSNKVPYAERLSNFVTDASTNNYYRMAYTVTIGAKSGEWHIYPMAPDDAISATWANIYPSLFTPLEEMPADIAASLRWPDSLKTAQDIMFTVHHRIDATGYYNRQQSTWARAREADEIGQSAVEAAPRFVQMRLPEEDGIEFVSTSYFTSLNKLPLIAGLYARSAPGHYGELVAVKLPADSAVLGFGQVDPIIQDDIGSFISLNNQEGKQIIYGDTVAVPVFGENGAMSIVYLKGIFLNVDGQITLKYVFVINGESKRVYAPTLAGSLSMLYGNSATQPAVDTEGATITELIGLASQHYLAAQECAGNGDMACYGREQDALGDILQALTTLQEQEQP